MSSTCNTQQIVYQLKSIERAVKTETQMMALRLDSIKRSIDAQAATLLAIAELLGMIAKNKPDHEATVANPPPWQFKKSPEDVIAGLMEEIKWIKAFTTNTGE